MDLMVIDENEWSFQINFERSVRFRQYKVPASLQRSLGAIQLPKGWGTALHVQGWGKASPSGFRERWKGDCTWRLDVCPWLFTTSQN